MKSKTGEAVRPERPQTLARALAWTSLALFGVGVIVPVSFGVAGVGDGDLLLGTFVYLFCAGAAIGLAGVVVSVLAALRTTGGRRAAAIRSAALAAVIPLLFALVWLPWKLAFEWGP